VGKEYGAKTTPDMFIVDPAGNLIYAGAIDDKPSTDPKDIPGANNYVAACLDASLAGKPVATHSTAFEMRSACVMRHHGHGRCVTGRVSSPGQDPCLHLHRLTKLAVIPYSYLQFRVSPPHPMRSATCNHRRTRLSNTAWLTLRATRTIDVSVQTSSTFAYTDGAVVSFTTSTPPASLDDTGKPALPVRVVTVVVPNGRRVDDGSVHRAPVGARNRRHREERHRPGPIPTPIRRWPHTFRPPWLRPLTGRFLSEPCATSDRARGMVTPCKLRGFSGACRRLQVVFTMISICTLRPAPRVSSWPARGARHRANRRGDPGRNAKTVLNLQDERLCPHPEERAERWFQPTGVPSPKAARLNT
jgi:hypothetical protein